MHPWFDDKHISDTTFAEDKEEGCAIAISGALYLWIKQVGGGRANATPLPTADVEAVDLDALLVRCSNSGVPREWG